MSTRKLATLAALALICMLAPAAQAAGTATVTIHNTSDWKLDHLYLSPADQTAWGPDQLGEKVIATGDKFTLSGIPCNTWDVKVVDEDGDECVIENVDLCKDNSSWTVTNKELLACQAKTN